MLRFYYETSTLSSGIELTPRICCKGRRTIQLRHGNYSKNCGAIHPPAEVILSKYFKQGLGEQRDPFKDLDCVLCMRCSLSKSIHYSLRYHMPQQFRMCCLTTSCTVPKRVYIPRKMIYLNDAVNLLGPIETQDRKRKKPCRDCEIISNAERLISLNCRTYCPRTSTDYQYPARVP